MCRPACARAAATPRMAALSDSVPPEVKRISPGRQASSSATRSRAPSSPLRAAWASR